MIGIKEFISTYKEPFDRLKKAKKIARQNLKEKEILKPSKKVLDEAIKEVIDEWDQKANWGTSAHRSLQDKYIIKYPNVVVGEYSHGDGEYTNEYILENNILKPNTRYVEKRIIDPLNGLIGYVDEVNIDKNWYINIGEFKSCKNFNPGYTAIAPNGFPLVNYYFKPISHVIDNNYYQAALQASFYMYLLWYYNKKLKPGKIILHHIKLSENGSIESVEEHEAPYMIEEVKTLLQHKKK